MLLRFECNLFARQTGLEAANVPSAITLRHLDALSASALTSGLTDRSPTRRHARRPRGEQRPFGSSSIHQVTDVLSARKKVVRNDASMTSPPYRLGAHHGASPSPPQVNQDREPLLEILREGVVGIVVEAAVRHVPFTSGATEFVLPLRPPRSGRCS